MCKSGGRAEVEREADRTRRSNSERARVRGKPAEHVDRNERAKVRSNLEGPQHRRLTADPWGLGLPAKKGTPYSPLITAAETDSENGRRNRPPILIGIQLTGLDLKRDRLMTEPCTNQGLPAIRDSLTAMAPEWHHALLHDSNKSWLP